jgi:hypothetical protein
MDSHADTCCFGIGATVLSIDTNTVAEVTGFSESLGKVKQVPIASVAVAYDCPESFETFILIFHQVLLIKEMKSHLICPNQLRMGGITVNDCPVQFIPIKDRTKDSHSILCEELRIKLKLRGVIRYFDTRIPTRDELNDTRKYPHIEMTSSHPWEPYHNELSTDEEKLLSPVNDINYNIDNRNLSQFDTLQEYISTTSYTSHLICMLEANVIVDPNRILATTSKEKGQSQQLN